MESPSGSSAALTPQTIVYDSICDACWKFFERPENLGSSTIGRTHAYYLPTEWSQWPGNSAYPPLKFHSILADMKVSARGGCHLCTLFLTSFRESQVNATILDTSFILANTWQYRDSLGQSMATVCMWPTKTNGDANKDTFFRRFSISRLGSREKNNIMVRRNHNAHRISEESLNQIKKWLEKCCRDHDICANSWKLTSKDRSIPTRLVEITKPAGTWRVRVIHRNEVGFDTSYATLSHCWGKSSFIQLTLGNQDLYRDNVPMESLPQTFKDAVELTYSLGLHYLWIDSLCIIQDSHADWLYEASRMGSVYAQGHINLAATYSPNGDGGLFNQSRGLSTSPCIFPMAEGDNNGDGDGMTEAMLYEEKVWQREVEATPLGRRAWVVQERVLAPRILHFSHSQLFWECCQKRQAELLPLDAVGEDGELKKVTPYPGTSEAEDPDRMWVHINWASLVEKYSTCSLTVQSDKLVAISGLARRVCGQLGLTSADYVAGLWEPNLIHGLLYRVSQGSSMSPSLVPGRAPSWSWASANGGVKFFPQDSVNLTEWTCASVLEVRIYPHEDPFGQLTGGSLLIQGPLAEVSTSNYLSSSKVSKKIDHDPSTFRAGFATVIYFDTQELKEKDGPVYLLILIIDSKVDEPAIIHGLLVRPTGLKAGQFERVGVMLYAQAEDFDLAFRNAKDPKMLDESLYQDADPEKGFTVVIL